MSPLTSKERPLIDALVLIQAGGLSARTLNNIAKRALEDYAMQNSNQAGPTSCEGDGFKAPVAGGSLPNTSAIEPTLYVKHPDGTYSEYKPHAHETGGSHPERYRVALQKIIDDGDYTAPEGMKLIAREALANGTCESRATLDVLAERRRQVTVEGWTPEHDDQHNDSELAEAAVAYASHAASRGWSFADSPDEYRNDRPFPLERAVFGYGDVTWPKHWSWDWWKPTNPRRDLVKAAALIIAEIERLDRHSQKAFEQCFALVQRTTFPCTLAKGHSGPHEYSQSAEKPR